MSQKDDLERALIDQHSSQFVREGEEAECELKPEDAIPDLPENQAAREFLKSAPTHGLFMPLGKEVKVMQCWRCKAYGHRCGICSLSSCHYRSSPLLPYAQNWRQGVSYARDWQQKDRNDSSSH